MSNMSELARSVHYKSHGDPHMKPNRYAFLSEHGEWNCVKYGGNFNDKFWIVSDKSLTEDQMKIVCDKLGMRPGIDKIVDIISKTRMGKKILWFQIEW